MLTRAEERRLAAYERTFGVGLAALPWPTPKHARAALSATELARLAGFERRLRSTWLDSRPHVGATEALALLDPASRFALYPGAPASGPTWWAHSMTGDVTDAPFPGQSLTLMPRFRAYRLNRRGTPFADIPVTLAPLVRTVATLEGAERLLLPVDAIQQLRMVLYRRGRASLFVGTYRARAQRPFSDVDHALLFAARPALRAWLEVALAIGIRPIGDGALVTSLDAFGAPALLVRKQRVVWTNALGARELARARDWLAAGRPPGYATSTTLTPGGVSLDLVLPRTPAPPAMPPPLRLALPPSLARIAERLARGAADKEIANELSLSVRSVRTYTARIYERLGIHGRRELMTRLASTAPSGDEDAGPAASTPPSRQ